MAYTSVNINRFYGRERELQLLKKFQEDVFERGISRFVVVCQKAFKNSTDKALYVSTGGI